MVSWRCFMPFGICLLGFIILCVGLGVGAYLLAVPAVWIAPSVIFIMALGILTSAHCTRERSS